MIGIIEVLRDEKWHFRCQCSSLTATTYFIWKNNLLGMMTQKIYNEVKANSDWKLEFLLE